MSSKVYSIFFFGFILVANLSAQEFKFGADLSYVNEMEDCGVVYKVEGVEKDVYQIFEDYGCNLVRYRLWHNPSWYDTLNAGLPYSDLEDVKKSISRAKAANMEVLLDFHLSDRWADPSNQLVPAAWLDVVDDTDILGDSLYNYIYEVLTSLDAEGLCPEMLQIGNETNRGILLSPEDNQSWTLDWPRNAALFNRAIAAVRDFGATFSKEIEIVLHVADPEEADWYIGKFIENEVLDFDIIGLSYYWQWHQPLLLDGIDEKILQLKGDYNKEVLIVETGYHWTTANNDLANNILTASYPAYTEISPEVQRTFLIELAQVLHSSGALGLVYWEPAWQSSSCFTPWGQGSHMENASFFDFDNELLIPGGIEWMQHDYGAPSSLTSPSDANFRLECRPKYIELMSVYGREDLTISIYEAGTGRKLLYSNLPSEERLVFFDFNPNQLYFITLDDGEEVLYCSKYLFIE